VLIASMIFFLCRDRAYLGSRAADHAVPVLTAPITANFIAKTYMARNLRRKDLLPRARGLRMVGLR
jgi:multicomponent K+:H+ antiporter subunit G